MNLSLFSAIIAVFFLLHHLNQDEKVLTEQKVLTQITHQAKTLFLPGTQSEEEKLDALLAVAQGKALLVNFGAKWCGACKREKENIHMLVDQNKKIKFVRILIPEEEDKAVLLSSFDKDSYPIFSDEKRVLAESYQVNSLPQTLLFNQNGELVYRFKGAIDSQKNLDEVQNNIDSFLKNESIHNSRGAESTKKAQGFLSSKLFYFNLQDSLAKDFSSEELKDKVWLANFIFTSCPSICPTLTKKMRKFQDEFQEEDLFELVSFSVDPDNDTPQKLREYKKKYHLNSQWHLLTGSWDVIKKIISKGFKIGAPESPMFHSEKFVLLDKGLQIRGFYSSYSPQDIQRLRKDIKTLLLKHKSSRYSIVKKSKKSKNKKKSKENS